MRFLVDECAGPAVAQWLRDQRHEVFSVYDQARGSDDDQIILKAMADKWILITTDKGFGDKVHRDGQKHCGVVLLRLNDERPVNKIRVVNSLLSNYADRLPNSFVVVTEDKVRFAARR